MKPINETIFFSTREVNLPQKVKLRDSKIAYKLIRAQQLNKNEFLKVYLKEHKNLSDERYWEILRSVWVISGGMNTIDIFRRLMKSNRKQKHFFSTPEESKFLRELPNEIEIYRACNIGDENGLSWSLNYSYTLNYQKAFNKEILLTKKVNKKSVFAYIERNGESEILIL